MFDIAIVGGGPAGYHGALKAAQAGLTVVLISDGDPGGVCLHSGCIPSKTVLHSTKLAKDHADFAIYGGVHQIDLPVLHERTHRIISTLARGVAFQLKSAGVTVIQECAEILPRRGELFAIKAGAQVVLAKKLLLATGSSDRILSVPGSEQATLTHITTLLETEHAPNSLLVIGAGGAGLELALIFARCGSKVTVIEKSDHIAPHFDKDLTAILEWSLNRENITIHTNSEVVSIHNHTVTVQTGEEKFTVHAEQVLPVMGRTPNSAIPGIVHLSPKLHGEAIAVDAEQMTSVEGCYAAGDCTGYPMLAHRAYYEAEVAIAAITGKPIAPCSEVFVPSVLYTTPELAAVGITEAEARELEIPIVVKKRPLGGNGRFLAETAGDRGLCKVILHAESKGVLGVHLIAPNASEVISVAGIAVQQKLTAHDFASIIFPHPTIGEIVKQTIVEE